MYVMLCYIISCYVMFCYVLFSYVMLCYVCIYIYDIIYIYIWYIIYMKYILKGSQWHNGNKAPQLFVAIPAITPCDYLLNDFTFM